MRAVVQRVSEASVTVDGRIAGAIGRGFLVLVCAMAGDTSPTPKRAAAATEDFTYFSMICTQRPS